MKVLMVLTSHDKLGDTGRKTGFWLEELAAPYYEFTDAGAQIALAKPKGGRPPLDPKSQDPSFQTDITRRFEKDADAEGELDKTVRLESVKQEDYDTVFGRPWPDLGPGQRPQFHQADRVLSRRWQACGTGLPCPWRAAPRQDPLGHAAGRRQEADRVHQRRGGGRRLD